MKTTSIFVLGALAGLVGLVGGCSGGPGDTPGGISEPVRSMKSGQRGGDREGSERPPQSGGEDNPAPSPPPSTETIVCGDKTCESSQLCFLGCQDISVCMAAGTTVPTDCEVKDQSQPNVYDCCVE